MVTFTITAPLVDLGGYNKTASGSTIRLETVIEDAGVSTGGIGFSIVSTYSEYQSGETSFSEGNSTTEEISDFSDAFIEYNRSEEGGELEVILNVNDAGTGGFSATLSWNGAGTSIAEGGGGGSTTSRIAAGFSTSEKQTTTNQDTEFDELPAKQLRVVVPKAIATTTGAVINNVPTTVNTFINSSSTAFQAIETTSIWVTTVEDDFQIFQERTILAPPEDTPTTLEPPPLPDGTFRGTYDVATVVVLEKSDCVIHGTALATINTYNISDIAEISADQQFTVYPSIVRGTREGDVKREGIQLDQDAGVETQTITSTTRRDTTVTFRDSSKIPTPSKTIRTTTITTEEKEIQFSDPKFTGYKTTNASLISYSENAARIGTLTWIETYPITSTIRNSCGIALTDSDSGQPIFYDEFGQGTTLVTSSSENGIEWTEVTTGCWFIINPISENFAGSSYYNAWVPVSALSVPNNFGSFLSVDGIEVSVPRGVTSLGSITGYVNPITSWSYISQNATISASGDQSGLSVTTINQTGGRPSTTASWISGGTPVTTVSVRQDHIINIAGKPAVGSSITVTRQYGNWFTYFGTESGSFFYDQASTREQSSDAERIVKLPKPVAFIGGTNSALTFSTIRNNTDIPKEETIYSRTNFPFVIS